MSLYDRDEICPGCKHAEMCECCGALKGCRIGAKPDNINGDCENREDAYTVEDNQ